MILCRFNYFSFIIFILVAFLGYFTGLHEICWFREKRRRILQTKNKYIRIRVTLLSRTFCFFLSLEMIAVDMRAFASFPKQSQKFKDEIEHKRILTRNCLNYTTHHMHHIRPKNARRYTHLNCTFPLCFVASLKFYTRLVFGPFPFPSYH